MTSPAAARPVPVSLATSSTQTFARCSGNAERPTSSSVHRTNANEMFVCSSSLSSIAGEHSHHHQRDSILPGGRNGILNGPCSKYDCVFKPLLDPSPSQLIWPQPWPDAFYFRARAHTQKGRSTPPLKSDITDSASGKFSSQAHSGVTLDLSGICFVFKLIAITEQLICCRGWKINEWNLWVQCRWVSKTMLNENSTSQKMCRVCWHLCDS